MSDKFYFEISENDRKKRLEDFLRERFPTMSKIYLREAVRDGKCEVNGEWKNRGYLLKTADFVEADIEYGERNLIEPEPIALEIIYEDADVLLINKRAGMLVHPTVKVRSGTVLNAAAFYFNARSGEREKSDSGYLRAGLVHRLDKKTSGLLLLSKNARAHRILSDHFKRKLVEKKYFALVSGAPAENAGQISAPIGRYEELKRWNVKADGKESISNYRILRRTGDRTLLEMEPVTGRTNQLRIHLAHLGHPIIGDETYGGEPFERMCLHACKLVFHHPSDGRMMNFATELPADFGI